MEIGQIWSKHIRRILYERILVYEMSQGKTLEDACKENNIDINDVQEVCK